MKKILSQQEKDDTVAIMFASNPKINTLYVTCDGHGFTTDTAADGHASGLVNKVVQVYERLAKKTPKTSDQNTSKLSPILDQGLKNLKPALEEINDVKALEALSDEETKRGEQARTGAIKLIAERMETIMAEAIDVNDATDAEGNAVK